MIGHWLRRTFRPTLEDIFADDAIARLDDRAEDWRREWGCSGYRAYTLDRCNMRIGVSPASGASVWIWVNNEIAPLDELNARRVHAAVCRLDAFERARLASRVADHVAERSAA